MSNIQIGTTALFLLSSAGVSTCLAQDIVDVRIVAVSGQNAPGTDDGSFFAEFPSYPHSIQLNDFGQTAFIAVLDGTGVTSLNNHAIFAPANGSSLTAIARRGSPAPGLDPGGIHGIFPYAPFVLNDLGEVLFYDTVYADRQALFGPVGSSRLTAIAVEEEPAEPFGPDIYYDSFGFLNLNNNGQFAFSADASGPGQDISSILSNLGGKGLGYLVRSDEQAGGLPDNIDYESVGASQLNDRGQVSFYAKLTGDGVDNSNDDAFYKFNNRTGHDFILLARENAPVPIFDTYVEFWSLIYESVDMNNIGQVAFSTALRGDGIDLTNNRAIFLYDDILGLAIAARTGDTAPGLGGEVDYDKFELAAIQLNDDGQLAFKAKLTGLDVHGLNDIALFAPKGGEFISAIAREGDAAPDFPDEVFYASVYTFLLNDDGQVCFYASLYGDGLVGTADRAIFGTDRYGVTHKIVADGDTINVSTDPLVDDLRVIDSLIGHDINLDFGDYDLNNAGEVAFRAEFTDGSSGIFVATIPSSQCLADVNGDGLLTPSDFTAWISAFNLQDPACDQNGDGDCTPTDFTAWISNYTAGCLD